MYDTKVFILLNIKMTSDLAKFNETLNNYTDNLTNIKNSENFLQNESLQTFLGKQKEDFTKALQIPQAILTASTAIQSSKNLYEKLVSKYREPSEPQESSLKQPEPEEADVSLPEAQPRSAISLGFDTEALPFPETEAPIPVSRTAASGIASLPKAQPRSAISLGIEPEPPTPAPRIKTITQEAQSLTEDTSLESNPFQVFRGGKTISSTFVRTAQPTQTPIQTSALDDVVGDVSSTAESTIADTSDVITEGVSAATDVAAEGVGLAVSTALDAVPIIGEIASLGEIIGLAITGGDDTPAPQLNPKDFDASFKGLTVAGSFSNTRQAPVQAIF